MKFIICIFAALILTSCASNHQNFYRPYYDVNTLKEVEVLRDDQEPLLYTSDNIDRDVHHLMSKHYIVIGYSSFNGGYEDQEAIITQAKSVGATAVISNSTFTNTATTTSMLVLPNNQTTYHSGSVSSRSFGYGNVNSTYSGTSTTYGTKTVPVTSSQNRYDQVAIYLVKSTAKPKIGIYYEDLSPEQRSEIGRNTGTVVTIVMENTPAFAANLLTGDIIIAIDGREIEGIEHANRLFDSIPEDSSSSVLTILRKGSEKIIVLKF